MGSDKMSLKAKGLLWELVLQGGGAKFFLIFIAIVGVVCFLFSLVTKSLIPLGLFGIITAGTLAFLCYLASTPEGRLFFLDSNSFVRVIKMQMELMGNKGRKHLIGPKTQFVQPVFSTPGDVLTEAKSDSQKALAEKL